MIAEYRYNYKTFNDAASVSGELADGQPTDYKPALTGTNTRPVARIFVWGGGVRSLERKGYFCQRFSVAVKSIYNQLRHDNSLLL